jgi:hypothetical protein
MELLRSTLWTNLVPISCSYVDLILNSEKRAGVWQLFSWICELNPLEGTAIFNRESWQDINDLPGLNHRYAIGKPAILHYGPFLSTQTASLRARRAVTAIIVLAMPLKNRLIPTIVPTAQIALPGQPAKRMIASNRVTIPSSNNQKDPGTPRVLKKATKSKTLSTKNIAAITSARDAAAING